MSAINALLPKRFAQHGQALGHTDKRILLAFEFERHVAAVFVFAQHPGDAVLIQVESLLCTLKSQSSEHEGDGRDPMPGGEGFGETFVTARQAAEAAEPAEGPFDDPATRHQHGVDSPGVDCLDEWLAYYDRERISGVISGVITLRHLGGRPNWTRFDRCKLYGEVGTGWLRRAGRWRLRTLVPHPIAFAGHI